MFVLTEKLLLFETRKEKDFLIPLLPETFFFEGNLKKQHRQLCNRKFQFFNAFSRKQQKLMEKNTFLEDFFFPKEKKQTHSSVFWNQKMFSWNHNTSPPNKFKKIKAQKLFWNDVPKPTNEKFRYVVNLERLVQTTKTYRSPPWISNHARYRAIVELVNTLQSLINLANDVAEINPLLPL